MRTLYFDCSMGAAGDMITAALLELTQNPESTLKVLNEIGLPGIEYKLTKGTLLGSRMNVLVNGEEEVVHDHHHEHEHEHHHHEHEHEHHHHEHEHEHHHHHHHEHHSLSDVEHIVSSLALETKVKEEILAVFKIIAEAEGHVHNKPMDQIHFHEVGTMDAIADVTAVCVLMNELKPEKVLASPIHVGSGRVRCAHGILPVPAPATAYILRGIPIYSGKIKAELCTPTGAAILKYYVKEFRDMPMIRLESAGYGLGAKEFEVTNCITAYLGETE